MRNGVLTIFLCFAIFGCETSTPETLVTSEYDEKEMDAAIARARSEVGAFVAELANPTGSDHAVKAPVEDGGKTEHFWLIDVSFANDQFEGTINNDPGVVSNVTLGQKWTVKKDAISDWLYMKDGKMYGNYTMRPLLKTMPDAEAEKFRAILANP